MLTQEDLQAIAMLINSSEERMSAKIYDAVSASETRMSAKIYDAVSASETRMSAKIYDAVSASETRMSANIYDVVSASETRMKTLIESQVIPQIKQIADGHLQISDQLGRLETRLDTIEETVTAHEWYIVQKAIEN